MNAYQNDQELFQLMKAELFTAVVGDVLDAAGYTCQFLPPEIKALDPAMMVAGRAMPVLEADCYGEQISATDQRQPFGLMFEALDSLEANEIYICTGSSPTYALWGELMSTRAMKRGAAGAVRLLAGYARHPAAWLSNLFLRLVCAGSACARSRN